LASNYGDGFNGAFMIMTPSGNQLIVIASDGGGWDHVSVSITGKERLPSWDEMKYVKDLFFGDDETVVQFLPKKDAYISHAQVLHLWKKHGFEYELPPAIFV